jgi:hypothetical protein
LDSVNQIKKQIANKYNKEIDEAMEIVRKASGDRIAELTADNEALKGKNSNISAHLYKVQTENRE